MHREPAFFFRVRNKPKISALIEDFLINKVAVGVLNLKIHGWVFSKYAPDNLLNPVKPDTVDRDNTDRFVLTGLEFFDPLFGFRV